MDAQLNKEIFSPTRDFGRKEKKVAALEKITMDDFLEFYERYLMGPKRRKISSQVSREQDVAKCRGSAELKPISAKYEFSEWFWSVDSCVNCLGI